MYDAEPSLIVSVCRFSDCVFDLCAEDGSEELRCASYEAYATICQEAGVKLGSWRQQLGCGKGAGSVTLLCAHSHTQRTHAKALALSCCSPPLSRQQHLHRLHVALPVILRRPSSTVRV